MTLLPLAEVEYRRISLTTGQHLRRQLLQHPTGWTLSNVVEVGEGPASLRGYDGGWAFSSRVYVRRIQAENNLKRNGWSLHEESAPLADTPTIDPHRTEWPESLGDNPGLCYCEKCHLQGAQWSYRGKDYHADCAGEVIQKEDRAKLAR